MSAPLPISTIRQDANVIGLVAAAHTTSHFFHLLLPSLFPWLKDAFNASYVELGLLVTIFFIVSSAVQFFAGFVVDRLGPRDVLYFGLTCLGLSALVLASAHHYAVLVAGAVLAGVGNGVFHPADLTLLNKRVSPQRLGHAFSMHSVSGTLGWALAPALLVPIAAATDWRIALACAGAVPLAVLALLLVFRGQLHTEAARDALAPAKKAGTPAVQAGSSLGFMRERGVWLCFGFFFVIAVALSGVKSFSIPALGELFGMSLTAATTAFAAYMLASATGTVLGGFVASGTARHDRTIALALGASGAMSLVIAGGIAAPWLVPLLMAAVGFGAGLSAPSRDLLIRGAAPKNATGRVYGVVYSGLDVGFSLGPLAFGLLMDAGSPAGVFVVIGLFQMAAVLTALGVGGHSGAAAHRASA
ncbi:MFS transporter [Lacisediminimonas profundi]|uniref:MFS transporter n=1 Tax=Lacisediminimonas profundi TaxID=2603856 RepID=UPI00124B692E|nr:MFS transporter [Lacisediminimonas profundi]